MTTVLALTGTEDITIADIAAINIIETRLIDLILSLINRPLADRINKTILSSYLTATLSGHNFIDSKIYFYAHSDGSKLEPNDIFSSNSISICSLSISPLGDLAP